MKKRVEGTAPEGLDDSRNGSPGLDAQTMGLVRRLRRDGGMVVVETKNGHCAEPYLFEDGVVTYGQSAGAVTEALRAGLIVETDRTFEDGVTRISFVYAHGTMYKKKGGTAQKPIPTLALLQKPLLFKPDDALAASGDGAPEPHAPQPPIPMPSPVKSLPVRERYTYASIAAAFCVTKTTVGAWRKKGLINGEGNRRSARILYDDKLRALARKEGVSFATPQDAAGKASFRPSPELQRATEHRTALEEAAKRMAALEQRLEAVERAIHAVQTGSFTLNLSDHEQA